MMSKKIILFVWMLMAVSSFAAAQKNNSGIAPFSIKMLNGKTYTYKQLKPGLATMLVYFSPTCDHCKTFTEQLLKHSKAVSNKQIIMVTYLPVEELKPFDSAYHISSKTNFKMGTEGYSFIVRRYYDVQQFPFVVIYNKQMKLVKKIPIAKTADEALNSFSKL